jgi:16S rRNA (guanine966-N2)-methyltransferase
MPAPGARITGGEFAGRVVRISGQTPDGFRPTAGRVREAVFNILGNRVTGARFLDLYAGSGLAGFEAMSRGADSVTFVEAASRLVAAIQSTADTLGASAQSTVCSGRLPGALADVTGPFDVIYLDPPYALGGVESTLAALAPLLAASATVVYEHSSRYNPPQRPPGLALEQRRVYGDSAIAFYRSSESE